MLLDNKKTRALPSKSILKKSIISSADEVVHRYAEENAQFYKSVIVGLISTDFPARYGGFGNFEMLRKVLLEHTFLLA